MKIILCYIFALSIFYSCENNEPERTSIFVAPEGNDNNDGTLENPFESIEKACEMALQSENTNSDSITIYLRRGVYKLDSTIIIHFSEKKQPGSRIIFRAYDKEEVIISSKTKIQNWKKSDSKIFNKEAEGKIWQAEIPLAEKPFYTLFHEDEMLPRSRSVGFTPDEGSNEPLFGPQQSYLTYPEHINPDWQFIDQMELFTRTEVAWATNYLPLEEADAKERLVKTCVPGTYNLTKSYFQPSLTETMWFENSPQYLDEPGEWYLDFTNKILYLWPKDETPEEIFYPKLVELIRVEGQINYYDSTDIPLTNIEFHDITFTGTDRYTRTADQADKGLQHDWELFDASTAMLRFRGVENCLVRNCNFVSGGSTGIRFDLYSQKNTVRNCKFSMLGGAGILLAGYGPGTKDVNKNNRIINNHISYIGELYWDSPGIFIWQSGENIIKNNLLHHLPYNGIVITTRGNWGKEKSVEMLGTFRWDEIDDYKKVKENYDPENYLNWLEREPYMHSRNNLVTRNELHHIVMRLNDGNPFYISGTGRNNHILENYIHDCYSLGIDAAIRCDDDQHETLIEKNVIVRTRGSGICSKGKNYMINNILADILPAGHTRGYFSQEHRGKGSIIERNIVYSRVKGQTLFFFPPWLEPEKRPRISDFIADNNLYFSRPDKDWGEEYIKAARQVGLENNSISENPCFVDIDYNNFHFKEQSPVKKIGFEEIDYDSIGLIYK